MATFTVTSHGTNFKFDDEKWSSEFNEYLKGYALKVILDRASSQLTKVSGATDEERLEAVQKTAERLSKGELPSRGGVGKSRLSDEDYALKQALIGQIKPEKGETLEQLLTRYTKALAQKQNKPYHVGMNAKVQAKLEATEIYKKSLAARKATAATDIMEDLDL